MKLFTMCKKMLKYSINNFGWERNPNGLSSRYTARNFNKRHREIYGAFLFGVQANAESQEYGQSRGGKTHILYAIFYLESIPLVTGGRQEPVQAGLPRINRVNFNSFKRI